MFEPGKRWLDTAGQSIQAHGGGIIYEPLTKLYYWFGENRNVLSDKAMSSGISCYSSEDLQNWKNEGTVLPLVEDDPAHDLHLSKVVERPKVIYNAATRQYVMWLHIDTGDYSYARTGVAVSDQPTGFYNYLGSFRPNEEESRDFTVFKDEDEQAYLIYSSEGNKTLHITRLSQDYLSTEVEFKRVFVDQLREAPCVFRYKDYYYMITSGCTGWEPNAAEYAVANSMLGDWQAVGNPCVGWQADTTFQAQSNFVLQVTGRPGGYIFLADQWQSDNLSESRYVWLPIAISRTDPPKLEIKWLDKWDLSNLKQ
jgi:hypothetical protein